MNYFSQKTKLFSVLFGLFPIAILIGFSLIYNQKTVMLNGCHQEACIGDEAFDRLNAIAKDDSNVLLLTMEGKFKRSKLSGVRIEDMGNFDIISIRFSGVLVDKNYMLFIDKNIVEKIEIEKRGKLFLDP